MRSEANEKMKQPIAMGTSIGWMGCPAMLAGVLIGSPAQVKRCALEKPLSRDVPLLCRGVQAPVLQAAQLLANECGHRAHAGLAGALLGGAVVIGVGVDVIGVELAGGVGDELHARDLD